jgi:hypothetical protein
MPNTKKFLTIILLIAVSIEVQAQNRLLGAKVGPSIMDISPNNFNPNKDPRRGVAVGLSYEVLLKGDFSIGAEAIYNQRGFVDNFMVVDGFGNPVGEIFSTQFNYDYISFPLKVGKYVGKKIFGFGHIGIVPSILIKDEIIPGLDIGIPIDAGNFDLAGLAEIGGGYRMEKIWLTASVNYLHSITNTAITNTAFFGNADFKHRGMIFSLGLKYGL